MGKQTKNYRQTRQSRVANTSAQNYAKINRIAWHQKIISYFRPRGKGGKISV